MKVNMGEVWILRRLNEYIKRKKIVNKVNNLIIIYGTEHTELNTWHHYHGKTTLTHSLCSMSLRLFLSIYILFLVLILFFIIIIHRFVSYIGINCWDSCIDKTMHVNAFVHAPSSDLVILVQHKNRLVSKKKNLFMHL